MHARIVFRHSFASGILVLLAGAAIVSAGHGLLTSGIGASIAGLAARQLLQVDPSQTSGTPTSNPTGTGGSSNAASPFSSGPGGTRAIGALGPENAVGTGGRFSAADTTVVSGVRGNDNLASGSGSGAGSGSGTIGDNRGRTSASGRRLQQGASPPFTSTTLTTIQNPDAGNNQRGAISATTPSAPGAARGQAFAVGTGRRSLLQRNSVAAIQPAVAGTSTSLNGADRSASSIAPAGQDTQRTGTNSGSSGTTGSLSSANSP